MKVVCFYWQGDRWQETRKKVDDSSFNKHLNRVGLVNKRLAERYVNNLYHGVKKHTDRKFEFVCFTNENLVVNKNIILKKIRMVTEKGVLPRMYMFSEEAGLFGHQVLSLDIDVVIVGSLNEIMDYEGTFCVRESWSRSEKGQLDGDVMSFKAGPETENMFWKPLVNNVQEAERTTEGRERRWVRKCANGQAETFDKLFPGQVVSLKHHVRLGENVPENARIVSCHGFPRPHQINLDWIKENWK